MQQQQIHDFLTDFFVENNCEIVEKSDHYFTVQLTIDMDKKLMNRPFYWHYLEKTGGVPNPAKVTFITNQNYVDEEIKGEVIHFGSPRLSQIFHATKDLGSFVQMYEVQEEGKKVGLTPWLGINYKVSYVSDHTKEKLFSLGLHLITGRVIGQFHELLNDRELSSKISDYSYTLSYIISPLSGIERLDAVVKDLIQQEDHSWAEEAKKRWKKDQKLLEHFYENQEEKPETYYVEKEALKDQYEPKIKIECISCGLFYLKNGNF